MAITGINGSVKMGANSVTDIEGWKLDIDIDTKDANVFGSGGWKNSVSGMKSATGSINGNWNVASDTNGQKALQDAMLAGTPVTVDMMVDATHKYSGSYYIKKLSVDEPVDDKVKFNVELQSNGAIAYE